MSTLRVDTIENGGAAVNFTTDIAIGAGTAIREYYAQVGEPSGAGNGAVWWDTANSVYKLLIEGEWYTVVTTEPPPPMLGDRGLFIAGPTNVIDYVSIPTLGNATDFGDTITAVTGSFGASSNGSRAVFGNTNLEFVTISTPGNATSFGNLTVTRSTIAGTSGVTRGLFAGGIVHPTVFNTIDYITIATAGNATDFGDLTNTTFGLTACASTIYSVFAGGINASGGVVTSAISYVTTDTLGNATVFGNLSVARHRAAGFSDGVRGVFAGGGSSATFSTGQNVIDYITISTPSNATDFGDLGTARNYTAGNANTSRGLTAGGYNSSNAQLSSIEYITIATTANAASFGSLTTARGQLTACSGN